MGVPFVRDAYNYDTNAAGDESGLDCSVEPSMAKQSFQEECDINTIVRRFGLTGQLPANVAMPTYADFEEVMDFQSAMNALVSAKDAFMQMPAEIRARFHNDPGEFVDFCSDDKNRAEAEKLGLVKATKAAAALAASGVPAPSPAPVSAPAASAAAATPSIT